MARQVPQEGTASVPSLARIANARHGHAARLCHCHPKRGTVTARVKQQEHAREEIDGWIPQQISKIQIVEYF